MKLSIIVPAHNEEDNIGTVIKRLEEAVSLEHELVVVNDHSTDLTAEIVKDAMSNFKNVLLVDNRLKACFGNAIKTGFQAASGDLVVAVMGDLCDDLNTINLMLEKIEEGYDVVCGSRYMPGGQHIGGSKIKALLSRWGDVSLKHLLNLPMHDISNAFKMYRKKVIDSIEIESQWFEISMEIPLKAYYAGFRVTEVPTVWRERTQGVSSFKVFSLLPRYIRLYAWAIGKSLSGAIKSERR